MNLRIVALLVLLTSAISGCKDSGSIDDPEPEKRDTLYLLNKMTTTFLLTPSAVTQTETFSYNKSRQLTQHSFNYKSALENYTTNYTITYSDGKVSEVSKAGTKPYLWKKLLYSYAGNTVTVKYVYPESEESIVITLNSKGLAEKIQGNGQYYQLTYDADGNIQNRSQYENANPAKPSVKIYYTYDKKHSPLKGLRDNIYILYQAFNDINACVNNRVSNNSFELYNHTYNAGGFPTKTVVVHSSVAVKKIEYNYTMVVE